MATANGQPGSKKCSRNTIASGKIPRLGQEGHARKWTGKTLRRQCERWDTIMLSCEHHLRGVYTDGSSVHRTIELWRLPHMIV